MNLITDVKQLLARAKGEDPEMVALRKRIATLEIQGGRLKEERDQARRERDKAQAHLEKIRTSIAIMT
jgi:hypothetical protein